MTEGGPIQESVGVNAQNLGDDPVFSVGGDLAFNWGYFDNGHRITYLLLLLLLSSCRDPVGSRT